MRSPVAIVCILAAVPASAHGGHPVAPASLLSEWRPDPLVSLMLILAAILYGRGLSRLWSRAGVARGIGRLEVGAFSLGIGVMALALLSPLETATGTQLTAHMVQHVLLIAIAPPLILMGRPDAAFVFAARALPTNAVVFGFLRRAARPLPAASLHALAVWIWHAPGPFQAALQSDALHHLEHASFLLTALLFWQSVLAAFRSPSYLIAAIVATLVTLIQGGFLGALVTLSGRLLYPSYSGSGLWGLSPIEDQQLAGLVMWVPMGGIYLVAGLLLAARLIGPDERPASRRGTV